MGDFRSGNSRGGGFGRGGGFNRGGRSGGFSRGGDRGGFGRDSRPMEMHTAICSNCKKECQVPFKPTGSKPVFCSDCFRQEGGNNRSEGRSAPRRSEGFSAPANAVSNEQIKQINAKLDKILLVLKDLEIADDSEESDDAGDLDDTEDEDSDDVAE
ncbi:MAG: CxxC-x17-CxxC domain-containing protein [Nanoarchaeota archaeon]